MQLSRSEHAAIGFMRYNRAVAHEGHKRVSFDVAGLSIRIEHRHPSKLWGRFGGGWQWKLGVQVSQGWGAVILNFLVFTVRICRSK